MRRARPSALASIVLALIAGPGGACVSDAADATILNVSFDASRELFDEANPLFARAFRRKTGRSLAIHQSHGGSGKQARAVIEGLEADVVTLALAFDIDKIASDSRRIPRDWATRFPHGSSPFTSTVVFLVRKGNPRGVRDWDDLARPGTTVVTPNPKVSGSARWNYLGAWAYATSRFHDQAAAEAFMVRLYRNAPVLDSGARASGTTFAQRLIGDVLVTWESEAMLLRERLGRESFEIIAPSVSVLAELPVAVVEQNARKHGVSDIAHEYLAFLFGAEGQRLGARHHLRPRLAEVASESASRWVPTRLVSVQALAGGWQAAQAEHFGHEGSFDRVFRKVREDR